MLDVLAPDFTIAIVRENGKMFDDFSDWAAEVSRAINALSVADGTGTPEGSLSAEANKFYRDTVVPNLYWKSVDDVASDTTLGWLLVV